MSELSTAHSSSVLGAESLPNLKALPSSVHLKFYFAPHYTREDFRLLPELFKQCDVYIPETPSWDENLLSRYQRIGLGSKSDYLAERHRLGKYSDHDAKLYELGLIYGGHKKITLIGLVSGDPTAATIQQCIFRNHYGQYPGAEQAIADNVEFGELQRIREEAMLRTLGINVGRLVAETPKLAEKPRVNVLLSMGPMHTAVGMAAAKTLNTPNERRVSRAFNQKPLQYPLTVAIARRQIFEKSVDISSVSQDLDRMSRFPDRS